MNNFWIKFANISRTKNNVYEGYYKNVQDLKTFYRAKVFLKLYCTSQEK